MSEIDKADMLEKASVAILPLGTGNDLSKVLGWGNKYSDDSIKKLIKRVKKRDLVKLDRFNFILLKITCHICIHSKYDVIHYRWSIKSMPFSTDKITQLNENHFEPNKLPLPVFNNYFCFGTDAKVALDFHTTRENNPDLFSSRTFNRIIYVKVK
jgi:diacylglycerol kinase (ATP)